MASVNMKKRIIDLLNGTYAANGYYGLADVYADTDDLAEQVWNAPTYSDADRTAILASLNEKNVNVFGEYPRHVQDLPALFVYRASDAEPPGKTPLGGYLGEEDSLGTDSQGVKVWGTYLEETMTLSLWTSSNGPGQRDDLYLLVRELIIRGREWFHDAGVDTLEWKSGKDSQMFRPDAIPQIIHTAEATIGYYNTLFWNEKQDRMLEFKSNLKGYNQGEVTTSTFETTE